VTMNITQIDLSCPQPISAPQFKPRDVTLPSPYLSPYTRIIIPRPGRSVYTCQISIQGQEFIVGNASHLAHTGIAWPSREYVPTIILLNKWLAKEQTYANERGVVFAP